MKTLEDHLLANAKRYPEKTAIICGKDSITYGQLAQMVEMRAETLLAQGIRNGQIVPIRSSQGTEFLVEYIATHLTGATAAPLEKDIPAYSFYDMSERLKKMQVPEGIADVLFTTGTTGKSKGVMISHEAIIANAENLAEAQKFCHELVFIISGPLNHIGSLSKVYPIILLGATLYLTDGMKNTEDFFTALNYPCRKMATFLVPASIRMLMQFSSERLASYANKIDFMETGAAPIVQSDMEKLCKLLPVSRLYNTYASTETGIVCTHDFNSEECIAGCLGKPMRHSQVFITEDGHVACRGRTLMSGYVGDLELTKNILYNDTIFTSDNGYIDSNGRLHLTGRHDDVINVGGFKVDPSEVEEAALSMQGIKDCICIAASHPITGSVLKLLVVLDNAGTINKKRIAQYLKTRLESYKVPLLYEQVGKIERTFNGKTNRKYYYDRHV